MTTQTTAMNNEKSAEATITPKGTKVTNNAKLKNVEPAKQSSSEPIVITTQNTDIPAIKQKRVATAVKTGKSHAKKTAKKNNAASKKGTGKEKKTRLASTCYHYYRHFLKDFLRPLAPSLRFQKSPDSYDGHLTIVESEKTKGLKALEKWNKENPDTKELFWDIKK